MEGWQREFLRKNGDKLLQDTTCNVVLLTNLSAAGILSKEDQEQIQSLPTRSDQVWLLYDMVEKRSGGYAAIATALAETMQTGACKYFLQGYAYGLFNSSINFLGQIKGLSEYLSEAEMKDINQKIRAEYSLLQCINVYENLFKESQAITLVNEMKLPKMPFYIPRMLLKRVVINKKLFQKDCNDIFVFKGVQSLVQLVGLVRPQRADWSDNQQEKLTCRFIQLQKEQHWDNILEIAKDPIHLIKYEQESDSFVLEQTRGASKVIRKYLRLPQVLEVERNEKHDAIVTEEKFIDDIINGSSSGVCICDSPGMGKTFLLERLANKIAEQYSNRLVAFIKMPHFIQHIKKHENLLEISSHYFYDAVLDDMSTTPIAKLILVKILEKGEIPLELLFDGFDEVQTQDNDFTRNMLMELTTNFPYIRVYVTSRPHKRHELEASLGVIAYDILPFSKSQQITFLVKFWKNENSGGDEEKLCIFAQRCLETVKRYFTTKERNITGIPLTCRLLAQVYARKAKIYSTEDVSWIESCKFEDSLPNLYNKYIEKCFAKLDKREGAKLPMKEYHTWMALKTICPELQERYFQQFLSNHSQNTVDLSFSVEILEKQMNGSEETVEFVHRTLAEYFLGQFFAQILEESNLPVSCSEKFEIDGIKYLLEKVLMTEEINSEDEQYIFLNPNLVYFLNYFLLSVTLTSQLLFHLFPNSVAPDQLSQMIFGCMRNNYANTFGVIKAILLCIDGSMRQKYKSNLFPDGCGQFAMKLLNIASFYADFSMVDQLFAFFSECFAFDLKSVCRELPLEVDTPLHFAIERADVQMVQLLADLISLKDRKILLSCVVGSNEDSPKIISQKVEICKILLEKDGSLLTEAKYTLCESVHVELLKVLIDAGADPRATKLNETVVHRAAKYMSNGDFHEICRFLIVERKVEDIFCSHEFKRKNLLLYFRQQTNLSSVTFPEFCRFLGIDDILSSTKPQWNSLLSSIFHQQKNLSAETLKMILDVPDVDVNEFDRHGNTPFLLAVKEGQDEKILVVLAEAGADINAVNFSGQNALIVAAKAGNTSILPFLLRLPIDHCHCDNIGNTFLHAMGNEGVTAEEYHEVVSLLASAGLTEIFHVKNDIQELPVHSAIKISEISVETLELFKTHEVDFSSVNVNGNSLLMLAAFWKRSVNFLSTLFEFGVDVSSQDKYGNTFAHFIAANYSAEEYHEIMQLLIDKGHATTFQMKNMKDETPLHVALVYIELLPKTLNLIRDKIVIQKGFSINCKDIDGYSLLMAAATGKRSFQNLKLLIDMGVDLMIQNSTHGSTFAHLVAIHYSAEEYHTIIELLVHNGHEKVFQVRNYRGATPLHHAAFCLEELLEKTLLLIKEKLILTGVVDINSTNNDGNTILMNLAIGIHPSFTISPHTPLRQVKWSSSDPNFLTYSSLQGRVKGNAQQWNIKMFRILIEMGADVMKQNKDGDTFAHFITKCYSAKEYHDIIQLLIEHKCEQMFAVRNYTLGATPFHYAVLNLNLLDSTLELLNLKVFQPKIVDINITDADGRTVLMCAALANRTVEFLKRLIHMGADVMAQNNYGYTFIHYFVTKNYSAKQFHQLLDFLDNRNQLSVLKIANKQGENALHHALYKTEPVEETLELFKSKIVHPDMVDVNVTTQNGESLLLAAAFGKRSIKVLQLLIEMSADTSIQDEDGDTFAHVIPAKYSAEQYHNILEILFEKNCEKIFQVVNKYGQTPLHCAVFQLELLPKTLELVNSKVIQTGIVDVNLLGYEGDSLLCCAATGKRSITFLKTLLDWGVDVMNENNDGDTFVHLVALCYSPVEYHHILELLVERGHEKVFTAVNKNGLTPVHRAIWNLELLEETLQLLSSTIFQTKILDVNSSGPNGNSFLMYAVFGKRSIRVLNALIEMGVSVMKKDIDGHTFAHLVPLYYSDEEYHEILTMLFEKGNEEAFKILNAHGLNPIHNAVYELEVLDITLEMINSRIFETKIVNVNSTDKDGNSLLHYAVFGKRSAQFLAKMMELGVDVSITNKEGQTFAHVMVDYYNNEDYHDLVALLLENGHGNALHTVDNYGMTPLHHAVHQLELFPKTLGIFATSSRASEIKAEYDVKQETSFQPTKAIQEHSPGFQNPLRKFMKTIFTRFSGSDLQNITPQQQKHTDYLNAATKDGSSILHWALRGKRSMQFVQHLVDLEADWSALDNHKCSLAHYSAVFGLIEHLEYFVLLGCDVNALNNDGENVLHCAVKRKSENVYEKVMFLIEKGADKIHKNKKQQTAYDYAIENEITDSRILNALM